MKVSKLLVWLLIAVVAWVVLSAVASAVFAAIAFVAWLIRTAIILGAVGLLAYGAYKAYQLLSGSSSSAPARPTTGTTTRTDVSYSQPENSVDSLKDRYAKGELDESELERRLERELADDEMDSIDRELQRERS